MAIFNALATSYRRINTLLCIAIFTTLCTFCWIILHELNTVKVIHHIVTSDFNEIELQVEKYADAINNIQPLRTELQNHLSNHVKKSYIVVAMIIISLTLLLCAFTLTWIYFRKLKSTQLTKKMREEFLYYDQLIETHSNPINNLPTDIKDLQLNRDLFITELQKALVENQFILYYQPIINVNTRKIVDIEALVRWQHPVHGLLSPDAFIPLCENSDFIITLGKWVLQTACSQIKKWHSMGFSKLCISVNLSPRQLNDDNLYHLIKDFLAQNEIPPSCLKLEITESSFLKNTDSCLNILKSLRNMGLQLSLDDFGTRYSTLDYIKRLPINSIKIDKMFITDITSNITSLGIVKSVINLAKSLGLTITAEGVENKHQLHMLEKMQCDLVQGYLYSKPIPAAEFTKLLYQYEKSHLNQSFDLTLDDKNFKYEILSQRHYDQTIDIITHTFCHREPMTKCLGITPHEFTPFAKLMVEKAIKDGLSIVALDNDTVCACTIVEDGTDPLNITINLDSRFKIIFSLLENLASEFFNERILSRNHIAHLFITAVAENYLGRGLSKKINFESIQLARKNGFDFMYCEFTHDYNEKGTVKNLTNNKLLIRSCLYKDFVFNGEKPFQSLEGSASTYIWELREGVKLKYNAEVTV